MIGGPVTDQIPIIVISLQSSVDRRAHMREHLGRLGLQFQFFDAIDGSMLACEERRRYEPTMAPGSVGCAESYRAVLHGIAGGSQEFVCVLEDDAALHPAALDLLRPAELRAFPRFDILRLSSLVARPRRRLMLPVAQRDQFSVVAVYRPFVGSAGQIFSRAGAQKALQVFQPMMRAPFDIALFEEQFVLGLRVIETKPNLVTPMSFASTIGYGLGPPHTVRSRIKNFRRRRRREWRNAVSFVMAWGPEIGKLRIGWPPSLDLSTTAPRE